MRLLRVLAAPFAWCRAHDPPHKRVFRYSHVHSVRGDRPWHADNKCVRRVYCDNTGGDGESDKLYFASEQDIDNGPDVPDCFRDVDSFKPARICSDAFVRDCGLLDNDAQTDMRFTLVFTCSHDDYKHEFLCNVVLRPDDQRKLRAQPIHHLAQHVRVQACPTCVRAKCTMGKPPPFDLACDVIVSATWDADAQKWRVSRFGISSERNLWLQLAQQNTQLVEKSKTTI